MKKILCRKSLDKIDTTIGELIETITQIALEAGKTEEEGYQLAALTIEKILARNHKEQALLLN